MNQVDRARWLARLIRDDPRGMAREVGLRVSRELSSEGRAEHHAHGFEASVDRYRRWITATEPDQAELERQKALQGQLHWRPLISILTPVLAPPEFVLVELLDSVLAQTYDNFELCIGHFDHDPASRKVLQRYADADPRVRLRTFGENAGISVNSTRCFEESTGEYLALLDHDDTISPNALYEFVVRLNQEPFDLAYSDRDKLDTDGLRHEPFFKTSWAPETLFSTNYLTHLTVFSRTTFLAAGGWEPTTDGAQDWDLFLRIAEHAKCIAHIPKVLYHWRVSPGSTASAMSAKPYSWAAQRHTVQRRLERMSVEVKVVSRHDGSLRLDWKEPVHDDVQIVVLASSQQTGERAVRHLRRRLPGERPIHTVLPGSADYPGTDARSLLEGLGSEGHVVVIQDGIRLRRGQSLAPLLGWLTVPGVAAVGAKVIARRGGISDIGRVLHLVTDWGPVYRGRRTRQSGPYGSTYWYANVYAPSLGLFALSLPQAREALDQDESEVRSFLDLFVLLDQAGRRCVYTPDLVAVDGSAHGQPTHQLLTGTCRPIPDVDPYFNPNLSREHLIPTVGAALEEASA